ncbi:uncharacterized protein LOC110448393 [Mizuhopecten yessoensis]|uniref:Uncharacterized protein n=1 Tax=Mizuhopecten yessoensis TaxID=6573 RepID=A0A210QT39_MIZYE|nr:uncharacterized protein LOC110448393 [Mizuhopecten yessoensis]OWF51917.1 hypothetical protein KP79_PYT18507 [Mizuhopecten yessoensis]
MNIKDVPTLCIVVTWTIALLLPVYTNGFPYNYPEDTPAADTDITYQPSKRNGDGLSSLCPGGVNKLRCIHSYLSLYARIQNGLTDPVSVRNIGKRNMPYDKKGVLMCPAGMDKFQCYDNAIEYYIRVMKTMSS